MCYRKSQMGKLLYSCSLWRGRVNEFSHFEDVVHATYGIHSVLPCFSLNSIASRGVGVLGYWWTDVFRWNCGGEGVVSESWCNLCLVEGECIDGRCVNWVRRARGHCRSCKLTKRTDGSAERGTSTWINVYTSIPHLIICPSAWFRCQTNTLPDRVSVKTGQKLTADCWAPESYGTHVAQEDW